MPLLHELKYIPNKYSALEVHWVPSVKISKLLNKLNSMFQSIKW